MINDIIDNGTLKKGVIDRTTDRLMVTAKHSIGYAILTLAQKTQTPMHECARAHLHVLHKYRDAMQSIACIWLRSTKCLHILYIYIYIETITSIMRLFSSNTLTLWISIKKTATINVYFDRLKYGIRLAINRHKQFLSLNIYCDFIVFFPHILSLYTIINNWLLLLDTVTTTIDQCQNVYFILFSLHFIFFLQTDLLWK